MAKLSERLFKKGKMIHKKETNYIRGIEKIFYWYKDKDTFNRHKPVMEAKGYVFVGSMPLGRDTKAFSGAYMMKIKEA